MFNRLFTYILFIFILMHLAHAESKDSLVLLSVQTEEINLISTYTSAIHEGLNERYNVYSGDNVEDFIEEFQDNEIECTP